MPGEGWSAARWFDLPPGCFAGPALPTSVPMSPVPRNNRARLREVALVFLRLGVTGFGGPAAHIGMMEEQVVRRRGWVTHEEFLDLLAAVNLIPGPNSTELAIHLGHRRAGWPGLIAGGVCFALPAFLIVLALAWVYVRFGQLPRAAGLLYAVKPVLIVIVAQALWNLGRRALKDGWLAGIAAAGVGGSLAGLNELALLATAGFLAVAGRRFASRAVKAGAGLLTLTSAAAAPASVGVAIVAAPFTLGGLGLFFLKVGSVLFGSGYVLLAFLQADLVDRWHWLTQTQLLDAVAVGQVTPGPLFTTATFIGYLLGGVPGAVVGTLGIFLPSFVFVALSGPLIPKLRRWPAAGAFLDGVVAASLALMAVVTWQLGRAALVDWVTWLLAGAATVALVRFKVNSTWLVLAAALAGLVFSLR